MTNTTRPKAFGGDQARQPFVSYDSKEPPKPALNAYLDPKEMGIHILGLSATGVVIGLHAFSHYWVDLGDDGTLSINATLNYLQFAAKLHETSMMASISCVLLYFLHRRLVRKGVSFGHLDAPYMIGAGGGVGLLITRRFWSPAWRHKRFFLMLLLSILFTLTLNPASAIAMIPSLAYWPLRNPYGLGTYPLSVQTRMSLTDSATGKGNTFKVYFSLPFLDPNGTRLPSPWPTAEPDDGWPIKSMSCFNATAADELDCAAGGMNQIAQWMDGNILLGSSTNLTMNEVTNFQRVLVSQPLQADTSTFARNVSRKISTTPTFLSTTAIGGFWAYVQKLKNARINDGVRWPLLRSKEGSSTYQPILYSQCFSDVYNVNNTGSMHNITLSMLQAPWANNEETVTMYIKSNSSIFKDLPTNQPRFDWFQADTMSALSVTILPIEVPGTLQQSIQSSLIITCMFDARWAGSTIKLKPRSSSLVESNLTDFSIFEESHIQKEYHGDKGLFQRALNISDLVKLPTFWLDGFRFNVTDNGTEIPFIVQKLDQMLDDTTRGNKHFQITDGDEPQLTDSAAFSDYTNKVADFMGTFQSMLLADGMARFATLFWQPHLELPSPSGQDNKYVNLIFSNYIPEPLRPEQVFLNGTKADAFAIEFEASRYGYGYGFYCDESRRSVILATSLLGTYCAITIFYIATIVWNRFQGRYTRSQAWEAMINLVALAKNSEDSKYLVGTGAGVGMWETWRLKVQVRQMDDEKLNLAFMRYDEEEIGDELAVMKKYD
jgi:hypothetical protein